VGDLAVGRLSGAFERHPTRLAWWTFLVGVVVALSYASRSTGGKPPRDYLYTWSAVANGGVQYALLLGFLAPIAIGLPRRQLGLVRPPSWGRAVAWSLAALAIVFLVAQILGPILHPDREQGLTPNGWDGQRAAPFAANFVVIAVVAPIVEELTFRGVGYGLLAPYDRALAVAGIGIAFGLAHGLVEALPILVAFGTGLAWVRDRTGSVFPGVVIHACWNAAALLSAVHWFHAG
jgi:membrane protease YdiL (CAAX protease family)